jgi:hypothetical protein
MRLVSWGRRSRGRCCGYLCSVYMTKKRAGKFHVVPMGMASVAVGKAPRAPGAGAARARGDMATVPPPGLASG